MRRAAGAAALMLPAILAICAPGAPGAAGGAPVQTEAFAVGYTLEMATARAHQFVRSAQRIQDVGDDTEGAARMAQLAAMAADLRRTEAQCYTSLARRLVLMGAPTTLRDWANRTRLRLIHSPVLSRDERKLARREPTTAAVLAALDETSAVKAEADRQMSLLTAWLRLTHSAAGVWTAQVGALAAGLEVALEEPQGTPLAPLAAKDLHDRAPQETPAAVRRALETLVPRGGNLAFLAAPASLKSETLRQAHDALLRTYDPDGTLAPLAGAGATTSPVTTSPVTTSPVTTAGGA